MKGGLGLAVIVLAITLLVVAVWMIRDLKSDVKRERRKRK